MMKRSLLRGIMAGALLAAIAWSGAARADDDDNPCQLKFTKGTVSGRLTGWDKVSGVWNPVAVVGIVTSDGGGNFKGTVSGTINGTPFRAAVANATFTLNKNCTGSMTVTIVSTNPSFTLTLPFDFIVTDHDGVIGVSTQQDTAITFTAEAMPAKGKFD